MIKMKTMMSGDITVEQAKFKGKILNESNENNRGIGCK